MSKDGARTLMAIIAVGAVVLVAVLGCLLAWQYGIAAMFGCWGSAITAMWASIAVDIIKQNEDAS